MSSLYAQAEMEENTDVISQLHAEMIAEDIQYGLNEHHRTRRNDPLCPLLDLSLIHI